MNNYYTQHIINEAVDRVLLEFKKGSGLAKLARKYQDSEKKESGESTKDFIKRLIEKYQDETKQKKKYRKRKKAGGGSIMYDYDDFKSKHKNVSSADSNDLRNAIDQEKTDIAAVAREIFPDHTDEGAQSQLRKILNGERDMTEDVAAKLRKMIDSGQVAVK